MPTTTVQKMTGAVTILISWMNASASHLSSLAKPGAASPTRMPATIATRTQNQSCRTTPPRRPGGDVVGGSASAVVDIGVSS